jgi:uncharacterized protein (DUF1697 family)
MNATMAGLRTAFEAAGFTDVKTVLGSGNIIFSARAASESALAKKAERAMQETLGRSFLTIVRPLDALRAILDADPYARFRLPSHAKRVVTFLRDAPPSVSLPLERDGAQILCVRGQEVFSAYVPSPRGPVFMTLLLKTFGDSITTRTWETVKKIVADPVPKAPTRAKAIAKRAK